MLLNVKLRRNIHNELLLEAHTISEFIQKTLCKGKFNILIKKFWFPEHLLGADTCGTLVTQNQIFRTPAFEEHVDFEKI